MPGFEFFGDAERNELKDVLDNGILMRYGFDALRKGHYKAKSLEEELQNTLKVNHVQLVSSGTAAVSVALAIAGVGAGDEVIVPTFTFVATFEAVMMLGAIPVLVDIDETLTLDPVKVEQAITSKTKAIMPVHMCGSMADLDALHLGTYGDVGCLSFDFVKTITCGEGGAILTNNKEYAVNADQFSDHGHDHIGTDRGAESHPVLGYNFRISELHAAVGLAQVRRLKEFIAIQKQHYSILREELSKISEITFRKVPDGGEESYAFLNFYLPNLDIARKVSKKFKDQGIDACFHYYDNNWHYVRKWDHLKEIKSLYPISAEVKEGLKYLKDKTFDQSDHFIGRNISCLIKLSWSKDEVKKRAEKMVEIIKDSL